MSDIVQMAQIEFAHIKMQYIVKGQMEKTCVHIECNWNKLIA